MKAKKSLGQNFLKDKNVIDRIIGLLDATKDDLIVEIGPGRGALTKKLSKLESNVICFEIDTDMHSYLDSLESDNLKVVYDDILNVDLKAYLANYEYERLFIVGNLPYYITTPIMEKIVESKVGAYKMIFMVQDEVADRLSANPGSSDYGYMTVYLNHYYQVKKEFVVSKFSFDPAPKVESAIITLNKKLVPRIKEKEFFKLVKDAFRFKRKNIRNNLNNYDLVLIEQILNSHDLSLSSRSEQLSEEIFIEIFKGLNNN